jgi:hypothetical protein
MRTLDLAPVELLVSVRRADETFSAEISAIAVLGFGGLWDENVAYQMTLILVPCFSLCAR